MQCTSYTPVVFHARDLNVGANSFSWHLFNGDPSYREQGGYNFSVPQCTMKQYLGYEKEVLSRMMQNHEATFRHQVQELHQLYKRQRELMDEIRARENFMQHLQLQASESNHSLSQPWRDISRNSHTASWLLGDSSDSKLSVLTTENSPGPATFAADYSEFKAPSFRSRGHEERILDLELLAGAYHDGEGRQFKVGRFFRALEVTCHPPKRLAGIQPSSDSELVSLKEGDLSSINISSRKHSLIDLNAPASMEFESLTSNSTLESYACLMEINYPHPPIEANPESVVPKNCGPVNCDRRTDSMNSSVAIDLNSTPLCCLSEMTITPESLWNINHKTKDKDQKAKLLPQKVMSDYDSGVFCSSKNENLPGSGVEKLALKYSSELKDNENADRAIVLECGSARDHAMRMEKCVIDNSVVDAGIKDKFLETKTHIDLDANIVVDEPSPSLPSTNVGIKSAEETNFEAPVSPDNKEGSPPRGKSDNIQLETTSLLSEQGEREPTMELDRIAAKTLIMIFSSGVQEHVKAASTEPVGSFGNCLHWFAGIVSSTGDDLEEVIKLQNGATGNDDCMLDSNDFGAIMQKQSEENAVNLSYVRKKEKETGTFSSGSGRGHARRKRHSKAFQTEVLASLASVFKDIQMVEGQLRTGSLRKYADRNACAKVRRHSKLHPSDINKSMSSILKQDVLQGWEKKRKRQGGSRRPASKFLVVN